MILKLTKEIEKHDQLYDHENLCEWCMRYRYSRAIQSVLSLSF